MASAVLVQAGPLISAAAAIDLFMSKSNPNMVFLDCSHDLMNHALGRQQFEQGHLPSARFVSVENDLSTAKTGSNGRHPIPSRAVLTNTFASKFRLNEDSLVVAYDRSQAMYAGRLWWSLRWLGHANVKVLDGGFQAWVAAGGPVEKGSDDEEGNAATVAGTFSDRGPLPELGQLLTYEDIVRNIAADKPKVVVDARAADRFRGENETADPIGGHIPYAKNRFFRLNIDTDPAKNGIFKSKEALLKEFADSEKGLGINAGNVSDYIMQCGSGVTACHNLLALSVCGLEGAALYGGSWSEYCTRPGAKVATGDKDE